MHFLWLVRINKYTNCTRRLLAGSMSDGDTCMAIFCAPSALVVMAKSRSVADNRYGTYNIVTGDQYIHHTTPTHPEGGELSISSVPAVQH